MGLWDVAFLGLVQGLTEFLPISSSGHLVLFESLLGVESPGLTLEIALHAGTLLAVVWVYADDLGRMAAALPVDIGRSLASRSLRPLLDDPASRLALLVLAGTVPTGLMGLTFRPLFESLFDSLAAVGVFWIVTGLLLWVGSRRLGSDGNPVSVERDPGLADALVIGLAQGLAIAPGLSRSGTTIVAGLFRGVGRESAARFSFLLSLPAVTGAVLLDVKDISVQGSALPPAILGVGMFVAAFSGVVAIRLLLRFLREGRLQHFAYYCWIMGVTVLAWQSLL